MDGDCVRGCGWGLCERLWMGTVGGAVDGDCVRGCGWGLCERLWMGTV